MTNILAQNASGNYLGKLCPRKHNWNNSGKSLRNKCGSCIECVKWYRQKYKAVEKPKDWYLGKLCKNKHDFENSGKSLRVMDGHCLECRNLNRLKNRPAYREKNKERIASNQREYEFRNKEHLRIKRKEWHRLNSEKTSLYCKNYRIRHRESYLASMKICNSKRKQAVRLSYTAKDFELRQNQFEGCAYCGSKKQITLEHFVAVSKGGTDTLANIIPACFDCNLSKNSSDPKTWYEKQKFYDKAKWSNILKVLGKTEANYNALTFL